MRGKFVRFFHRNKQHLGVFGLGLFTGTLLMAITGFAPFGSRSLVSMDGIAQYYPMLREFKNALASGHLFYSFHGGLGFDLLSQIAYYTASPLWLILFLFSESNFALGIHLLTILRFGLAAMTFSVFCEKALGKKGLLVCGLAIAYSFSAYTIAFMNQWMWADTIVLLPLVALGLHRLIFDKKPLPYFVFLALTLICNFYLGFMVCIFSVLYALALLFGNKAPLRSRLPVPGRFFLWSGLAGFAAAFLLLPTYFSLQNTISSTLTAGAPKFYYSFSELFQNFMPFSPTSLEYGAPNLYCGVTALLSLPVYFFCNRIPRRQRLLFGGLTVFLLLSLNFNHLNYVWHGFHYPNQLPGRESFLLIFLMLSLSVQTLDALPHTKPIRLLPALSMPVAALCCFALAGPERTKSSAVLLPIGAGMMLLALCLMFLCTRVKEGASLPAEQKRFDKRRLACMLLALFAAVESAASAGYQMGWFVWAAKYDTISDLDTDLLAASQAYAPGENEFYRTEWMPIFYQNPGQMYHFNGISYYSSMMSAGCYRFLTAAGCSVYAENVSEKYVPTPVLNALFGVKYIFDRGSNAQPGLAAAGTLGDLTILENKYTLPLIMCAEDGIAEFTIPAEKCGALEFQNQLLLATGAADEPVFQKNSNAVIADADGDYYVQLSRIAKEVILNVNDGEDIVLDTNNMTSLYLGTFRKGDTIHLRFKGNRYVMPNSALQLYYFREDLFAAAREKLSATNCRVVSAQGSKITAEVTNPEDGSIFISIPYSEGWRLTCDGDEIPLQSVGDFLTCAHLPAGSHTLKLRYVSPGFPLGATISVLSILCAAVLLKTVYRKTKEEETASA